MNLLRHVVRRPAGHFTTVGDGPIVNGDMVQCVHCQLTWMIQPGSKKVRGWCRYCEGPTCGQQHCLDCVPWQKKIEEMERRAANDRALQRSRGL